MEETIYAIGCHENNGAYCTNSNLCWAQEMDDVTRNLAKAEEGAVGWDGSPYVIPPGDDWYVEWYEDNPDWGQLIVRGGSTAVPITKAD